MLLAKLKEALFPDFSAEFNKKRRLTPLLMGLGYIALIYFLGGMKTRHVTMGLLALLDSYNPTTRRFLKYFFPFILTGLVYDGMRYFYWEGIEGHVHVAEPYELEKKLFGIQVGEKLLTPNEFFEIHIWKIADLFCGFAYLVFVLECLSTAFSLFLVKRHQILKTFAWSFFLVNFMGYATYFIYPAAPPWYITQHGLGPALMHIGATASAAGRFDEILGTHFFSAMYSQSVDVYGAYPSLHVAYPLLVFWCSLLVKKWRLPAFGFFLLMCFSAVYLQHHYIIDVIMGITYTAVALFIVRSIFGRKSLANLSWGARVREIYCPTGDFVSI